MSNRQMLASWSRSANVRRVELVITAISDFTLALVPIFYVSRLKLTRKMRVGLCVTMSLGVLLVFQPSHGTQLD